MTTLPDRYHLETVVGVTLAVISAACTVLARVQLGKSFTLTPQPRELVTHGLYSRLQHPIYIFVDLTIGGIALALHRWYAPLPLARSWPRQMRNARAESRLLREKFRERYELYRDATWF
jgi:protein-S-isoprenylcysteine O-methyltransferase Ste14